MVLGALILKYFPAKRADFKKRELKATSILTSCASDLDLIADWVFFADVWNSSEDKATAGLLLMMCILGTLMWVLLITEGRILSKWLVKYNIQISSGHLILATVIVEDIPQIIFSGVLSSTKNVLAIINIMTAAYDILIKVAEAYEARDDTIKMTEMTRFENDMERRVSILDKLEKGEIKDELEQASAYDEVGDKDKGLGEYVKAFNHYQQALRIRERKLPDDDLKIAESNDKLGALENNEGNYTEARKFYHKALAIKEKSLPSDHPSLATSYFSLGSLEDDEGNYTEARKFYHKSLAIQEKSLPSDHPSLATSYSNLGLVEKHEGNYTEAKKYFHKSLAIQEKSLPSDHPDLAASYNNLGAVETNEGNYTEAKRFYHKSLAIQEKSLPSDHPNLAISYYNLADLLVKLDEKVAARKYFKKAKEIWVKKNIMAEYVKDVDAKLSRLGSNVSKK